MIKIFRLRTDGKAVDHPVGAPQKRGQHHSHSIANEPYLRFIISDLLVEVCGNTMKTSGPGVPIPAFAMQHHPLLRAASKPHYA